jgi:hypothetical protein
MYDATLAETVTIRGDEIEAYLARPMSQAPLGGVVVIHHMPGHGYLLAYPGGHTVPGLPPARFIRFSSMINLLWAFTPRIAGVLAHDVGSCDGWCGVSGRWRRPRC